MRFIGSPRSRLSSPILMGFSPLCSPSYRFCGNPHFIQSVFTSSGSTMCFRERPTRGEGTGALGPRKLGGDILTDDGARRAEPADRGDLLRATRNGTIQENDDPGAER